MKTLILDDDPTGSQSATDVPVLLDLAEDQLVERLTQALTHDDALYVLTNSRAIPEAEAVALVRRVRRAACVAAERLFDEVRIVLRGDSTLRGHVFAESDVFAGADSVLLFLPAFPAGGRTTRGGVHYVQVGERVLPAADTEYAFDPVFGYRSSELTAYVAERGDGRPAQPVLLEDLRSSGGGRLVEALTQAAPGTVVVPDAVTEEDVDLVHRAVARAWELGRDVVVRCGAPLAARCAAAVSPGLLPAPVARPSGPTLVVCGSHTAGATDQLHVLERKYDIDSVILDTDMALADPNAAAAQLLPQLRTDLRQHGLAVLTSERQRRAADDTLQHGECVMAALIAVVGWVAGKVSAVIAKGGITSAEVARRGLGVAAARVRGQLLPGVSVWDLPVARGQPVPYVVVPGNVGDETTLVQIIQSLDTQGVASRTGRP